MTKPEVKDIQLMLYKAQNPNQLYIGGIMPLNVETMTEVRNAPSPSSKVSFVCFLDIEGDLPRIYHVTQFCLD